VHGRGRVVHTPHPNLPQYCSAHGLPTAPVPLPPWRGKDNNTSTSMQTIPPVITGNWQTKEVRINGMSITPTKFACDLKATEAAPGDNWDILF
jgi:hypothetical protein